MSALDELFARTRAEGRAALIGYLPSGFPTFEASVAAMLAMVEAGVDAIEIGIPYSDPLMDGPVIQLAVDEALRQGSRTEHVLRAVRAVSATGAPVVVMGSWNPIEKYGPARFAADLKAAGGSGAITPDLIPEEAGPWIAAALEHDLDPVFLVAPSSTEERIAVVAGTNRGFVYAMSTMGVTGARDQVGTRAQELVARVRAHTALPVCVGLGVSTRDQATQVAAFADGVIVGSALVRALRDGGVEAVKDITAELAEGVRR
ncbi:MAG: tryptophan synthase subunit alpha [Actinomycetota bacterium]|nr:tryptophan synthase subunit alpha [Actinomycetota bacterium]